MAVRSLKEFFAPPLVTDILTGEFKPPSDPDEETHQLGRLATAAYRDGAGVDPTDFERGVAGQPSYLHAAQFTPTWARDVVARVLYRSLGPPYYGLDFLAGLHLVNAPTADRLVIGIDHVAEQVRLTSSLRDPIAPLAVALGATMTAHKQLITDWAQEFFNTVRA
jgi:hypothetical protein